MGEKTQKNYQTRRTHQLPVWQSSTSSYSSRPTQSFHGICEQTATFGDWQLSGDRPATLQRGHRTAWLAKAPERFMKLQGSNSYKLSYSFFSFFPISSFPGLSGAMASISVRSGPPGSPTHPAQSLSRRRNGLHDVDLNTFIAEEMALHLDSTTNRKRGPAPCSDVITDSPTHKRNRML